MHFQKSIHPDVGKKAAFPAAFRFYVEIFLKLEPELALERAGPSFVGDLAPRQCGASCETGGIDRQIRVAWLRVVEHIESIRAELQVI